MPITRMSRKESQEMTRQRLLDAALEVFSRQGYHAASVDDIAERAGYSKGAVYSNFATKEELFLALIDRRFASDVQDYAGIVDFIGEELHPERGAAFKEVVMRDYHWNLLLVEFMLYAIRDEAKRAQLASRLEHIRAHMGANLKQLYTQKQITPELPLDELPWSIFSLGMGLALQLYLEPGALPQGAYERALQHLLK